MPNFADLPVPPSPIGLVVRDEFDDRLADHVGQEMLRQFSQLGAVDDTEPLGDRADGHPGATLDPVDLPTKLRRPWRIRTSGDRPAAPIARPPIRPVPPMMTIFMILFSRR